MIKQYALINNTIKEVSEVKINRKKGNVRYIEYCYYGFLFPEETINCVTNIDNFTLGTKDELIRIIRKRELYTQNIKENKKNEVIKMLGSQIKKLNNTELYILDLLIEDALGVLAESIAENKGDIFYMIKHITKKVLQYMEFNSSSRNAYMDYMH